MPHKDVQLNLADRIAQQAAHMTLQQLGWLQQPMLLQTNTPRLIDHRTNFAHYLIEFPMINSTYVYKVMVTLTGEAGKWRSGLIYALHCTDQAVYHYTSFKVLEKYSYLGVTPEVTLGEINTGVMTSNLTIQFGGEKVSCRREFSGGDGKPIIYCVTIVAHRTETGWTGKATWPLRDRGSIEVGLTIDANDQFSITSHKANVWPLEKKLRFERTPFTKDETDYLEKLLREAIAVE